MKYIDRTKNAFYLYVDNVLVHNLEHI